LFAIVRSAHIGVDMKSCGGSLEQKQKLPQHDEKKVGLAH
jgi:hypothetical protein